MERQHVGNMNIELGERIVRRDKTHISCSRTPPLNPHPVVPVERVVQESGMRYIPREQPHSRDKGK